MLKQFDANLLVLVIQRKSPGSRTHNGCDNTLQRKKVASRLPNVVKQYSSNVVT
jgi:hypothetical protein